MRHHLAALVSLAPLAATVHEQQWQWTIERALPGELKGQLAYDEARERIVLFGSVVGNGPFSARSFTYEWDGMRWLQRAVEVGEVLDTRLCYDPMRRRIARTCGNTSGYHRRGNR